MFRYFHKVPAEAPQLELKASYGLAEPVPFELPALSEHCTPEVYATFDLTKGAKNDKVCTAAHRRLHFNTARMRVCTNVKQNLKKCIFFFPLLVAFWFQGQTQGGGSETSEGARSEASKGHRLCHLINIPWILSPTFIHQYHLL